MAQMIEEYNEIYDFLQRFVNENPDFHAVYEVVSPQHEMNHTGEDMLVFKVYKNPFREMKK